MSLLPPKPPAILADLRARDALRRKVLEPEPIERRTILATDEQYLEAQAVPPPEPEPELEEQPWGAAGINADHLDSLTFPPVRWIVPHILPVGGICLLAGAPKSGKSMLAIGLALAMAHNGRALGTEQVRHPGDVLFISLDDQSPARAQQRLRMIGQGAPLPRNLRLHLSPDLGRGAPAVDRLIDYLSRHPRVRLIVIDTVEHVRGDKRLGESAYSADVRFLGDLRRVLASHPDVTVLALAHTRKQNGADEDDAITAVSGTHGVTGGADHVLVLSGKRGVPRRILDVVSRDAEDMRRVLAFTAHGWNITDEDPDDPAVQLTADDAAVYRALTAYGHQGATATELEAECEQVKKIGNRLGSLERRGYIRRLTRGRYCITSRA